MKEEIERKQELEKIAKAQALAESVEQQQQSVQKQNEGNPEETQN